MKLKLSIAILILVAVASGVAVLSDLATDHTAVADGPQITVTPPAGFVNWP